MADKLECTSFDFTRIVSLLSFIRLEFCYQQDEIGFVPEPCWWRWQTGWRRWGVFSIRYPLWKSFFGVYEGKGVGGKSNCQSQPSVLHHPGKEIHLPLPPQSHLALGTSQLHKTCHSCCITHYKNINNSDNLELLFCYMLLHVVVVGINC